MISGISEEKKVCFWPNDTHHNLKIVSKSINKQTSAILKFAFW